MAAAFEKASSRKDLTEKQPAVEVRRATGLPFKFTVKALDFHSLTSIRLPFSPLKAAATGHNTVRFRRAEKFNALPLTVSSKGPIIPIEKNQKLEPYECGPTVFDANAKDPYGVADVSHVVFPANTLAGSWSSSAPFDQMLGYQFALANPDGALDGGRAVSADLYGTADRVHDVAVHMSHAHAPTDEANNGDIFVDFTATLAANPIVVVALAAKALAGSLISSASFDQMLEYQVYLANPNEAADRGASVFADGMYGAADRRLAVFADPYVHGGHTGFSTLFGAYVLLANLHGAVVARVVAADRVHGGAWNRGHACALGYQFALANPDGALDRGRAVFADLYGAADRVHDVAVHRGHARAPADEANNGDD